MPKSPQHQVSWYLVSSESSPLLCTSSDVADLYNFHNLEADRFLPQAIWTIQCGITDFCKPSLSNF
ncbi:hypothetical protein L1049_011417 [Liquidambar formosana]|uniref:Uncharacterized protein n=1 Tax=Liquidambar formosana TaxID=63359 RepID=A0AAP0RRA5_LIQFO